MPTYAQTKYNDSTTGGSDENTSVFGGISQEEIDALNQAEQAALKKFREGRQSSAKDSQSRFSGLEFHDEDGDGIADHDNTANDMEGGMDIAAIKQKGLRGQEREDKLQEARARAGKNCVPHPDGLKDGDKKPIYIRKGSYKKSTIPGAPADYAFCTNISANLVDMGAAHGDDATDPHRVYELTEEAYNKATNFDSGKKYSDYSLSMFNSAANYDAKKYGLGVAKNIGSDKSQIQVQQPNGQTQIVNVAPDIDLLRSEAAWLEQQKLASIEKHRLSLTMKKYLGAEGSDFDKGASSLVWANGTIDENAKKLLAQRIAEDGPVGNNSYVDNSNPGRPVTIDKNDFTTKRDSCITSAGTNSDAKRACYQKFMTLSDFMSDQSTNGADKKRLWEEGRRAVASSQDRNVQQELKDAQADVDLYKECLETGTWCINAEKVRQKIKADYAKANPNGPDLSPQQLDKEMKKQLQGYDPAKPKVLYKFTGSDVGVAFTDTREYNLTQLEIASKGPLGNFERTMRGMDLGPEVDQKTGSTQWKKLKVEIDRARNTYKDIQDTQKKLEKENPGYKSKYLGANFDENKQNTYQLFMRQKGRDGTTYGWGPQNTGKALGAKQNNPQQARQPAAANAQQKQPRAPQASGPWNQSNFKLD